MTRWLLSLLLIALLLFLAGCGQTAGKTAMYIQPAVLTEGEQSIARLLGADQHAVIYDFVLDDSVQSMQLSAWTLIDGAWQPLQNGWLEMKDARGRIALTYDRIPEYLRVAMHSEHHDRATAFSAEPDASLDGLHVGSSRLAEKTEIVYDQELPLVVQYMADSNAMRTWNPDAFHRPAELAAQGYAHVYAITVQFSQQSVGALEAQP